MEEEQITPEGQETSPRKLNLKKLGAILLALILLSITNLMAYVVGTKQSQRIEKVATQEGIQEETTEEILELACEPIEWKPWVGGELEKFGIDPKEVERKYETGSIKTRAGEEIYLTEHFHYAFRYPRELEILRDFENGCQLFMGPAGMGPKLQLEALSSKPFLGESLAEDLIRISVIDEENLRKVERRIYGPAGLGTDPRWVEARDGFHGAYGPVDEEISYQNFPREFVLFERNSPGASSVVYILSIDEGLFLVSEAVPEMIDHLKNIFATLQPIR